MMFVWAYGRRDRGRKEQNGPAKVGNKVAEMGGR